MSKDNHGGGYVHTLSNNISVVETRAGNVLINCPPETLKLLMAYDYDVPRIILLPPDIPAGLELGSSGFVRQGINYASIEFLLYGPFFRDNVRTTLITPTQRQADRLRCILDETIMGPRELSAYEGFEWLRNECTNTSYYQPLGHAPGTDDLANIETLEHGGGDLGNGTWVVLQDDTYCFYQDGALTAIVPLDFSAPARPLTLTPARPLLRHELTLQFIGGSNGFDPTGITTCFLAYLRPQAEKGVTLFDAAAYLRLRLGNIGISPRQISEVVLSHLHEDHLAGLPELLLMGERRVRLITSDIIYHSLLLVLGAMLDQSIEDVAILFDHVPLNPDEPIIEDGIRFESIYAVHSIPTIAVRANDLYYSGDMRYDEAWFKQLEAEGILTDERRQQLISFAEGAKVIVQDAGGGSIHTTITPEILRSLASKGQRVILAHTAQQDLPVDDSGILGRIEFASSGHIASVGDMVIGHDVINALHETLSASPLFSRLPVDERRSLAAAATIFDWNDGEIIIENGKPANGWAYIVHSGLVEICAGERTLLTIGRGSSVGERGALRGGLRTNSLMARGPVQMLGLPPALFKPFAHLLGLQSAADRADWLWMHEGTPFKDMLWAALLDLALDMTPRKLNKDERLFSFGEPGFESYLLISGQLAVLDQEGWVVDEMTQPGSFFGGRSALFQTPRNATAIATRESTVWVIPNEVLQRLNTIYPNLILHMRAIEAPRTGERSEQPRRRMIV